LQKLHLGGYRLEVSRVDKRGVQATQFRVILVEEDHEHLADDKFVEEPRGAHGAHEHVHEAHPHPVPPLAPIHAHQHHRSLKDILAIIDGSELSNEVKLLAGRIFTRLGEAEAKVHGTPVDDVHFHEVGGVDAIVDIVSTAIGICALGIEHVVASPLHLGTGTVRMSHGLYPIPAPATAQLVQGVPVYTSDAKGELVTPTGAAIVTTLASGYGSMPEMSITQVGYGAGTRDRDFPNVLRAFLGETVLTPAGANANAGVPGNQDGLNVRSPRTPHPEQHEAPETPSGYHEGTAVVIEANIDDMNPQLFEVLVEKLLAAGALDVLMLPAQMKKQRPGTLLQVLAAPSSVDALLFILFSESTTIGARTYEVTRHMLQRDVQQVQTKYGMVRVKLARLGQHIVNAAPEYEDCRALAQRQGVPVKQVYAAALGAVAELHW
jgi:uncharacterized protein (TIGR00299 family) protein